VFSRSTARTSRLWAASEPGHLLWLGVARGATVDEPKPTRAQGGVRANGVYA